MNRLSAVVDEIETSRRLVENALELVSSVPVLQSTEKDNVERLLYNALEQLKVTKLFVRACTHAKDHGDGLATAASGGGANP